MTAPMIDEELYNRQLYVMGHSAQGRMSSASILLVGLRGVGCEVGACIYVASLPAPSSPVLLILNGNSDVSSLVRGTRLAQRKTSSSWASVGSRWRTMLPLRQWN